MGLIAYLSSFLSLALMFITIISDKAGSMIYSYIGLVVAIIGVIFGLIARKSTKEIMFKSSGVLVAACSLVACLCVIILFTAM